MKVAIGHKGGLHTRVAATAAELLSRSVLRSGCDDVYLCAHGNRVRFTDLLAVVSLHLKKGDVVDIVVENGVDESKLQPLIRYLEQTDASGQEESRIDERIQEMVLRSYVIFEQMTHGLIVINLQGDVSYANRTARGFLDIVDERDVLGRPLEEILPNTRLTRVLQTGCAEIAQKQRMGARTVLTNRTPILIDGKIAGAMAVFQDISDVEILAEELALVKELKTRLDLVLQVVDDAICLSDETGIVRYVNAAYERLYDVRREEVIGEPMREGPQRQLYERAESSNNTPLSQIDASPTTGDIITDAFPVFVDHAFRGAVSISRSLSSVEKLLDEIYTLRAEKLNLQDELSRERGQRDAFSGIIGNSRPFVDALSLATKVAQTSSTVLITGESGTGKELVAHAIHKASARREHPFIRVNCAGIPAALMESELFGHERGAFTGAINTRKGRFELAQRGTIFLDEIGELPLEMQAKLLRVLQEREIERIGSAQTIQLDVRVIAATNRVLGQAVANGAFRADLYYRINVVHIELPPLHKRREDVLLLADFFLGQLRQVMGKQTYGFSPAALTALGNYDWPGNSREVKNVVERALNVTEGRWIEVPDLPEILQSAGNPGTDTSAEFSEQSSGDVTWTIEQHERRIIADALHHFGSFNRAGKALGISHKTVAAKARKYGLVER